MGQVTISFLGVCTIFRDLPAQERPPGLPPETPIPANRVVLARVPPDSRIQPHIARVQFVAPSVSFDPTRPPGDHPDDRPTFDLDGVKLRIANATGASLQGSLDCLPGLQRHLDRPLGGPALPVYVEDRAAVQAWFDLENGLIEAFVMHTEQNCNLRTEVPSIAIVTVETNGDPVIEYLPFGGGEAIRVTLGNDIEQPVPNVNVMNFAFGKAFDDDPIYFLLNYQLAQDPPPPELVHIPTENVCTRLSPHPFRVNPPFTCGDAGPGCSTTPFP